jgi:diadenosine tetraphosphatase ApaH/serine/threonine PP2A family protein phosphatase
VLADAAGAGAERYVLGGDYALFGAFPSETVARLRELDTTWIRGNTDRWLADAGAADAPAGELMDRSLEYCRRALGDAATELAALPPSAELDGVLFCHASPRSDMASFMPAAGEIDAELLDDGDPDLIVFGHTHLQFRRPSGRHTLLNPGSVGMPFDGDRRAAYALWRGGSDFELRRVAYDSDGYARALRERMGGELGDAVETLVSRIEQAAFAN